MSADSARAFVKRAQFDPADMPITTKAAPKNAAKNYRCCPLSCKPNIFGLQWLGTDRFGRYKIASAAG
ncbi:MAG: hypothetical protein LBH00_13235 [Planctomycetaceae bacterium]|nr:hypothetical protein [Planctomycetaceae bacterium]